MSNAVTTLISVGVIITMAVIRLFFPAALHADGQFVLDAVQTQYLSRSLRLRVGDQLTLFDGSGLEFPATLLKVSRREAQVATGPAIDRSVESPLTVRLLQGVSKGERMDLVVQKATELGVARISPVMTEYGMVKLHAERTEKRRDHWQRIARSACEQCGRNVVPIVDTPAPLIDLMGDELAHNDSKLILRPGKHRSIGSIDSYEGSLTLLVGPEGGFSNPEYERAAIAGFESVSLGPRVLRTETAAIAALAVVQCVLADG